MLRWTSSAIPEVAWVGTIRHCRAHSFLSSPGLHSAPTYPTNPIDSKVAIVRAFGAVIGKALGPLPEDRGLIQILVALQ
jgi:hypothetical protein